MDIDWQMQSKLWNSVDRRRIEQCWHWQAGRTSAGYGAFVIEGKQYLAHRVACAVLHGPPTDEKPFALHSCDTPSCCNPTHLRWGTPKENRIDAKVRQRDSKPPPNVKGRNTGRMPKGEALHNQSLTEAQVRQIWAMHLMRCNVSQIAEATGAKKHVVADVVRGRSWRHLDGAPSIDELRAGGARRGSNGFNELARLRVLEVRKAKG